jgi:hypothetical protein
VDIAVEIRKQINALTQALNALEGTSNGMRRKYVRRAKTAKRTLSAKARRAISKAQKARWAGWKKAKQR